MASYLGFVGPPADLTSRPEEAEKWAKVVRFSGAKVQ
jgi:hypothetical protein